MRPPGGAELPPLAGGLEPWLPPKQVPGRALGNLGAEARLAGAEFRRPETDARPVESVLPAASR